jgi:hypothetical protein
METRLAKHSPPRLFHWDDCFVEAVRRSAAIVAEAFRKPHHPGFSTAILGLDVADPFVHFEEVFTVITGFSLNSHRYGLTRQSQPFDNGKSLM